MITQLRTVGGFRPDSPNYVGDEVIKDAIETFRGEGFELSIDGELRPLLLEALSGVAVTDALHAYILRAKRGAADAALVTGTGKDLLEATVAHILVSLYGNYSAQSNFPTLLGQAFIALGLATTHDSVADGEPPRKRVERAMFQLACAINQLRNREGTGHDRPWLPSVTDVEARIATEFMGTIAEYLLTATEAVAGGVVSR
jgi:Abortive infection C-terminus